MFRLKMAAFLCLITGVAAGPFPVTGLSLRFTAQQTRRAYVHPARHFASNNTSSNLPPMGMRVRLKASFDISGYSQAMQVILKALKKYGMILADNGSSWYISGAPIRVGTTTS